MADYTLHGDGSVTVTPSKGQTGGDGTGSTLGVTYKSDSEARSAVASENSQGSRIQGRDLPGVTRNVSGMTYMGRDISRSDAQRLGLIDRPEDFGMKAVSSGVPPEEIMRHSSEELASSNIASYSYGRDLDEYNKEVARVEAHNREVDEYNRSLVGSGSSVGSGYTPDYITAPVTYVSDVPDVFSHPFKESSKLQFTKDLELQNKKNLDELLAMEARDVHPYYEVERGVNVGRFATIRKDWHEGEMAGWGTPAEPGKLYRKDFLGFAREWGPASGEKTSSLPFTTVDPWIEQAGSLLMLSMVNPTSRMTSAGMKITMPSIYRSKQLIGFKETSTESVTGELAYRDLVPQTKTVYSFDKKPITLSQERQLYHLKALSLRFSEKASTYTGSIGHGTPDVALKLSSSAGLTPFQKMMDKVGSFTESFLAEGVALNKVGRKPVVDVSKSLERSYIPFMKYVPEDVPIVVSKKASFYDKVGKQTTSFLTDAVSMDKVGRLPKVTATQYSIVDETASLKASANLDDVYIIDKVAKTSSRDSVSRAEGSISSQMFERPQSSFRNFVSSEEVMIPESEILPTSGLAIGRFPETKTKLRLDYKTDIKSDVALGTKQFLSSEKVSREKPTMGLSTDLSLDVSVFQTQHLRTRQDVSQRTQQRTRNRLDTPQRSRFSYDYTFRKPVEKVPTGFPDFSGSVSFSNRRLSVGSGKSKKSRRSSPWYPASLESVTLEEMKLGGKSRARHMKGRGSSQKSFSRLISSGVSIPTASQSRSSSSSRGKFGNFRKVKL